MRTQQPLSSLWAHQREGLEAGLPWDEFGTSAQSHTCASAPQSGIAPLGLCWQLRVKLRLAAGQELLHGTQSCCPSWAW